MKWTCRGSLPVAVINSLDVRYLYIWRNGPGAGTIVACVRPTEGVRLTTPASFGGPPPRRRRERYEGESMERDVVCGMQVDPAKAAATSEYNGKTYYFCAKACKTKFDANPSQYVK